MPDDPLPPGVIVASSVFMLSIDKDRRDILQEQLDSAAQGGVIPCGCGCDHAYHIADMFRCLYCGEWFCCHGAEKHFGQTRADWILKKRIEAKAKAAEEIKQAYEAKTEATEDIKLEAGKQYVTRNGLVTGPLSSLIPATNGRSLYIFEGIVGCTTCTWTRYGSFRRGGLLRIPDPYDIIAEFEVGAIKNITHTSDDR